VTDTAFYTMGEMAERLESLNQRVEHLENRGSYRIKLSQGQMLKLSPGDIVVFKIPSPLATSEVQRLADGWHELMKSTGHENVEAMFLSGADGVQVGVVRP
jgi:hypothetical protein